MNEYTMLIFEKPSSTRNFLPQIDGFGQSTVYLVCKGFFYYFLVFDIPAYELILIQFLMYNTHASLVRSSYLIDHSGTRCRTRKIQFSSSNFKCLRNNTQNVRITSQFTIHYSLCKCINYWCHTVASNGQTTKRLEFVHSECL